MIEIAANQWIKEGSGIITLCGSTRFFNEAMEANRRLTFNNWIVLACGSWGHSFHNYHQPVAGNFEEVKRLHFHKILASSAICIVTDLSLYVGSSTKAEIEFAKYRNKGIFSFDGDEFFGHLNSEPPQDFQDNSLIDKFENQYGSLGF